MATEKRLLSQKEIKEMGVNDPLLVRTLSVLADLGMRCEGSRMGRQFKGLTMIILGLFPRNQREIKNAIKLIRDKVRKEVSKERERKEEERKRELAKEAVLVAQNSGEEGGGEVVHKYTIATSDCEGCASLTNLKIKKSFKGCGDVGELMDYINRLGYYGDEQVKAVCRYGIDNICRGSADESGVESMLNQFFICLKGVKL